MDDLVKESRAGYNEEDDVEAKMLENAMNVINNASDQTQDS
jgi:hypothetical protein